MKFTHVKEQQIRFCELKDGEAFKIRGAIYMKLCDSGWSDKGYNAVRLQVPILEKIHANTIIMPLEGEFVFREKVSLTSCLKQSALENEDEDEEFSQEDLQTIQALPEEILQPNRRGF